MKLTNLLHFLSCEYNRMEKFQVKKWEAIWAIAAGGSK